MMETNSNAHISISEDKLSDEVKKEGKEKLWNANYCKAMVGNFMLFFSFYLLTPLLPIYLDSQFSADKEGVAELPLLKLLRIEYFEPNYDFSVLIRIFNSWRLKSRQI